MAAMQQNQPAPRPQTIDDRVRSALERGGLIDITTRGRRTGEPRRVEIVYHVIGGRIFISGKPNPGHRRAWLVNLEADPCFTFHLKRGVTADLPARARLVTDPGERRSVLEQVARAWQRDDVDEMVADSPLIEVCIEGLAETDCA